MNGIGVVLMCLAMLSASGQTTAPTPSQIDTEQTKWIDNALRSMQRIGVGKTRSDLLEVFTTEGGLSTTSQRTYVYRHCPYIKVDVKFAATSREEELPTDKIIAISRPYLDWSRLD
jgi:hypothetical protein